MKVEIRKGHCKTSPAKRAKARVEFDAAKSRLGEIESAIVPCKRWTADLIKAARFVVDVNGNPPSMDQLRAVVEMTEQQDELVIEKWELKHHINANLSFAMNNYQYSAGHIGGLCFHVLGQGDTRKEALANAKEKR